MSKNRKAEERRAVRAATAPAADQVQAGSGPTPQPKDAPKRKLRPTGPSAIETFLSAGWILPAILALAAVFRLSHVAALSSTPFFDHLGLDCLVYDEWAQRIAAGDWMGDRIFYQDPLYPYFLGVIYALFGRTLMLVYVLQVAFGVGTCWLTALLGRRIFGVAVGNLAGLMAAVFTPSIFYEVQIEKTFLSVFLVAAFLVLVLDRRTAMRAAAGAVLALASLTRANLILFIPLSIALLVFERVGGAATFHFLRKPDEWGLRQGAAFFGGCFLVLAPVALRNHHVEGQWVLTTSQAGQNFYIGNNPGNTTGVYVAPPGVRPDPRFEEMDFRAEAEKQAGRKLKPSEVSDFWSDAAWKHIAADPTFAQMMFLRKFMLFWNDYEVPDNLNMYMMERWSWVLRLPLLGIGLITALALLGGIVSFGEKTEVRVLAGFVAIYCVTVVAFFIFSRYRIQIVPVLIVLAAHALLWMVQQVRAARWENVGGGAAAVLLGGFFSFQGFDWNDKTTAVAISLNNLGALYMEQGDTPRAIATYEEAVRMSPKGVVGAIRLLGDYYMKAGDLDRAEQYMRQVVTLKPESQMGWNALATLYTKRQAASSSDPLLSDKLAGALLSAGRSADARRVVEEGRAAGTPPSAEIEQRLAAAAAGKR